jgi:methionyl-tRNA formyltransferase
VASFGYYLPRSILEQFRKGAFNIHPSLLPKYRGSSPMIYAIRNQDRETGVSIIKLAEKMDSGDILSQARFSLVDKKLFYQELEQELAILGAREASKILLDYQNYCVTKYYLHIYVWGAT